LAAEPTTARDRADEALADRDHKRVQWLLRAGLALSAALMTAGMALRMAQGQRTSPAVALFDLRAAPDLGLLLIASGILALAMTPALRVVALVWIWTRERDWRFVGVSVAVTITLAIAIAIGKG
jgi:uncharacterized membrane protein